MSTYLCAHNFKIKEMFKAHQIILVFIFLASVLDGFGQAVTIKYGGGSGNIGDNVVVDIRADGFTNVRNFNFLTQWDDVLLEYVSIGNINPALPAAELNFGTPDITGKTDRMTAALIQVGAPVEYSLGPNDIMFSLTLRIISDECVSTFVDTLDILPKNEFVVFNAGTESKIKPGSLMGEIDINPGCVSSNVLALDDASGIPGTEICIPFSAKVMTDLGGFNGLRVNWDPTVLTYTQVQNKTNPQGTPIVNDNNAGSGQLNIIYSYVGAGGIGLTTDSTALFCLCFTVIGDCDETIPLTVSRGPDFGMFSSLGNPINEDLESGSFTVNCCDATATITPVNCPGDSDGSIALMTEGCANITSYVWSNTTQTTSMITGLSGGSYDVTITYDGGLSARVISGILVSEPSMLEIGSISFTKVTNGGDGGININVVGGTPGYTYMWSNGATTEDLVNVDAGPYSVTVTDSRNCTAAFGPYTVATAPQISGTSTDITCFGTITGAVDINVSGGAAPYAYLWSCPGTVDSGTGDISGLAAGMCTVTVTDANNCASTMTFNIDGPASAISVNPTIQNDNTNDGNGSIMLAVSGGWGDYQFDWSDGTMTQYPNSNNLSGIFGGSYTVIITDGGGCSMTFGPFNVEGLRVVATDIMAVQCFGDNNGAIDILVTGGSGTYTYDWTCASSTNPTIDADGNISGLTSEICTVTVTDVTQNRTSTTSFTVPGPSQSLVVTVTANCANEADGSLEATVSGGVSPFSYAWNTNPAQSTATVTGLSAGDYSVLVTDSVGCQVMGLTTVVNCTDEDCYTAMDVITPNEDGKNDFFIIDCAASGSNKLRIFTRWGQEVIEYSNYQNNWDGRDEGGNLVDEDTYLWVLEVNSANGNTELFKGAVSVLYKLR
jgi:gliding motility-associated-like protein